MNMSDPNNYLILRQRIQEYAAKLFADGEGDKKFAEQMNLPSCKILGEREINIAHDLSDILQTIP